MAFVAAVSEMGGRCRERGRPDALLHGQGCQYPGMSGVPGMTMSGVPGVPGKSPTGGVPGVPGT
jgi:hypothetical protein